MLRTTNQPNLLLVLSQIHFAEVVLFHQVNEAANPFETLNTSSLGVLPWDIFFLYLKHHVSYLSPLRRRASGERYPSSSTVFSSIDRGRLLKTSCPSRVMSTSSSMRTPPQPAKYTPGSTVTTMRVRAVGHDFCLASGLVDVQSDTVPKPVVEVLAHPSRFDHSPSNSIHFADHYSGPQCVDGRSLSRQHGFVNL